MRVPAIVPVSVFLLVFGACAEDQAPTRTSNDAVGQVQTTNATAAGAAETPQTSDQVLNVGPALRGACNIDDATRAPKFDFDKANLSSNDRDIASRVAACMSTGPLAGRSIWLVGRTDPRGAATHNVDLGAERAMSFKSYLVGLGIDPTRILDTSRGAMDARGTNEETWRVDCRVDIELAQ